MLLKYYAQCASKFGKFSSGHKTEKGRFSFSIPKKKKRKKAKWLSDEALQTSEERREAKSNEERERYTQLNAEFQRIARRGKNFHSYMNNAKN